MVGVLVCKNDGCFEFETASVGAQLTRWSNLKMHLARVLYCEEELFAVASPSEIALYRLPDGESLQELCADLYGEERGRDHENDDGGDDSALEKEQIETLVVADSRWVLDIFSAPMRRMSDLTQQTDHAIRGMHKSSFMPIGRRTSTMPPGGSGGNTSSFTSSLCALGNERFADTAVASMGSRASMIGGALSPTSAAINASSVYHEPYIHIGTQCEQPAQQRAQDVSAGVAIASPLERVRGRADDYEPRARVHQPLPACGTARDHPVDPDDAAAARDRVSERDLAPGTAHPLRRCVPAERERRAVRLHSGGAALVQLRLRADDQCEESAWRAGTQAAAPAGRLDHRAGFARLARV